MEAHGIGKRDFKSKPIWTSHETRRDREEGAFPRLATYFTWRAESERRGFQARAVMVDVFSPEKRSQVMSRIRGRGNKDTEVALARLFRHHRISGWRRHQPIVGRPDFIFREHRVAVFVDGCFWHRCPKHSNIPANNRKFWETKLSANVKRSRSQRCVEEEPLAGHPCVGA